MAVFLENYTLLDQIGKGGFAQVCKVRHNKYRYIRAIKILDQAIIKGEKDENWIKFRNECETLLNIGNGNHPNIIHIYQPLLCGMQAFVEMDYIDGKDVTHILKETPLVSADEVIHLIKDISSALAYCHHDIYKFCMDKETDNLQDDPDDGSKPLLDEPTTKRLIKKYRVTHNDIHSGNIMRRESGDYVLLDFGLSVQDGEVLKTSKHKNGAIEYKAPEKWLDKREPDTINPATDIYSPGIVLDEYLTGQVPFPCDPKLPEHIAAHHVGEAHKNSAPPSIFDARKRCFELQNPNQTYKERDYPQWLEGVIMRCLEKDPRKRFRDGKELYDCVMENIKKNSLSAQMEKILGENKTLSAEIKAQKEKLLSCNQEKTQLLSQIKTLNDEIKKLRPSLSETEKRFKVCPKCGKPLLKQGISFCKYCGAKL